MEPEDLLRFVVRACEQLKLRYLVTGSTATIARYYSKEPPLNWRSTSRCESSSKSGRLGTVSKQIQPLCQADEAWFTGACHSNRLTSACLLSRMSVSPNRC